MPKISNLIDFLVVKKLTNISGIKGINVKNPIRYLLLQQYLTNFRGSLQLIEITCFFKVYNGLTWSDVSTLYN